ncbi:MAG: LysR family transcriptional regulator [Eubacteriales bacterium]|nr:LysR family transcriptional regulator [Eubacteriales bacterium]
MDFREMLYITTVADLQSVTAAAKKLYISQPSLSHIISKVEQDVGVRLFDRGTSPITLTYAGEKYVETARRVLMLNDNLRRELVDIGLGDKGRICFGMPTERAGYMLPAVARQFKEKYPHMELRLMESNADELLQALLRDEISFYIVPRDPEELPAGLKTELIYRERLYFAAPPDMVTPDMLARPDGETGQQDPLTEGRKIRLERTKDLPYILLKRGHAIRKRTDRMFKRSKMDPDVVMEVSSCISAVQLAASSLGVTIVPTRAVAALGAPVAGQPADGIVLGIQKGYLCYDFAENPGSWNVNAVYKEDLYLGLAERYLIDLLKQKFGGVSIDGA